MAAKMELSLIDKTEMRGKTNEQKGGNAAMRPGPPANKRNLLHLL